MEFEWSVGTRELICDIGLGEFSILATQDRDDVFEGPVDQRGLFGWISWLLGGDRPNV